MRASPGTERDTVNKARHDVVENVGERLDERDGGASAKRMYGITTGTVVAGYVLEQQLGEGGQGSVWQARPTSAPPGSGTSAIKIIPIRGSSPATVERVRREAEALMRLSVGHPSIVACSGVYEDQALGVLAVLMEKVQGVELQAILRDPRCDGQARQQILTHVARALAHLHESGFVHRDIKPQNILVTGRFFDTPSEGQTVKLVDFGIAVPTGNPKPLTEVGTVIGTPAYMAPERIDPMFWKEATGQPTEDIFAFGIVAFETFFGHHPTRVTDDGTLSAYAEKYREIDRSGTPWPPVPAGHPWERALGGALALARAKRLPNGGALVATITGSSGAANKPASAGGPPKTEAQLPFMAALTPMPGATPSPGSTEPAPAKTAIGETYGAPPGAGAYGPPPGAMGMQGMNGGPPAAQGHPYQPPPQGYPAPPPAYRPPNNGGGGSSLMPFAIGGLLLFLVAVPIVVYATTRKPSTPDAPLDLGQSDAPPITLTSEPVPSGVVTVPPFVPDTTTIPPVAGTVPVNTPPAGTGTVKVGPTATHTVPPPGTTTALPPSTTTAPPIGRPPGTTTTPPTTTTAPPATTAPPIRIRIPGGTGTTPPATTTAAPPTTAPPGGRPPIRRK